MILLYQKEQTLRYKQTRRDFRKQSKIDCDHESILKRDNSTFQKIKDEVFDMNEIEDTLGGENNFHKNPQPVLLSTSKSMF